ncbi:PREDICTED: zinc finger protein Xfin-like, partial [Dinoponera quadriceps]|uniref:Zinc finger protein Xfin-like n=1 Tax=Dinoponera quadriceps TaxID=609295 RepID=A0A6P3X8Z0_DINQU
DAVHVQAFHSFFPLFHAVELEGILLQPFEIFDLCYRCPSCHRSFKRKNSLSRHLLYACGQNPRFECPYCSHRCKLRSDVYRHVRANHKRHEVLAVDVVKRCVKKPCVTASVFAGIYLVPGLQEKLRNYGTHKKFPCPNCSRIFVWKCTLKRHLRNECGKEPRFKCPHCDYRGKWKANISRHIKRMHKNCSIYVLTTN